MSEGRRPARVWHAVDKSEEMHYERNEAIRDFATNRGGKIGTKRKRWFIRGSCGSYSWPSSACNAGFREDEAMAPQFMHTPSLPECSKLRFGIPSRIQGITVNMDSEHSTRWRHPTTQVILASNAPRIYVFIQASSHAHGPARAIGGTVGNPARVVAAQLSFKQIWKNS
jgi:hypothetical protein